MISISTTKKAHVKGSLPGPESRRIIDIGRNYEAQVQSLQAPIVWKSAKGCIVTDVDGNTYLDWTSGVLVTNVGHCHPKLVKSIQQAAETLLNCYEFPTEARIDLAKRMVEILPRHLHRAFFLTTGSEAVEAAIRVAKKYTGKYEIVSFFGGFHGRTGDARSAGGIKRIKEGYGPSAPGFIHAPYPYCYRCPFKSEPNTCGFMCLDFLDTTVKSLSTGSLAGVIVEPYQGTAGFIFPPDGYLKELEKWTQKMGMVFILDEVQSSFGRTGKFFSLEWEGLTPDLVCVGKGIGSGIPISAVMATDEVLKNLSDGDLGSTFAGNPFACSAALAVIDIMQSEDLVNNANKIGKIIKSCLLEIMNKSSHLGDVRGRGMVMGMEFVKEKKTKEPAPELVNELILRCAQNGLIIGKVGIYGNVVRVAPPLIMTEDEAYESLEIMSKCIMELE
ncbi:MAG: hypothetical protein A2X25_07595 [Chloroflexi bacterium GWB2_49_20]|nr:MAG: hypothetical protein A2X25_07595 [Chloroflexi bacterium GWB2_49_20]OGN78018.1 MAG: hypothetical protein A2X26_15400 [Chloroflexi bacterium GWC2_49_37]OGN85056.1 MAG: hypothetical protein A2X27_10100 [Chloroflexi bacterium GWD2_49_16]HBG74908.1 4-aminobutyrate--2-oxoglutarate transaminase [Anaerolineae bacterium]HCC78368.1 4-aminobutyrate--2-oxoglutarate transaminase [Anaerolineae bacterium]